VAYIVIQRGCAPPIGDRLGAGNSPASLQDSPPISGKNEELSDELRIEFHCRGRRAFVGCFPKFVVAIPVAAHLGS
jgi:hypothetical protein